MFRLPLLAFLLVLILPLTAGMAEYDGPDSRLPVVLVAVPFAPGTAIGSSAGPATRVIERAADHLRTRGLEVQPWEGGGHVVLPPSGYYLSPEMRVHVGGSGSTGDEVLTLAVSFPGSSFPEASGTETRFGGGDEAWRLASRVQSHLTSGLLDVIGYQSYDRGIAEIPEGGTDPWSTSLADRGDQWVATYPVFATNAVEGAMLESPGALDLLSMALANAVSDYLSTAMRTPARDSIYGWRQFPPQDPLPPGLVVDAEPSTRVALTFDAGSYPPLMPSILDTLRNSGVRCTMFLTGDYVDQYPETVIQMVRDGHEIGNHSDTHPDMPSISDAEMVSELRDFDAKVVALTGRSTRPWFRPPSGSYNDRVLEVAGQEGYYTIYWTVDSADWRSDVDAETVRERLLNYSTPGSIVVAHLTSPQTAEVLPEVLQTLKGRGVEFALVSEVIDTRNH